MIREALSKPFPDRIAVYHSVAVRDRPLFDARDVEPGHKAALAMAARNHSEPGDTVTVVGGGRGIVPTILARHGRDVRVYEAASQMVDTLAETQRLNAVSFDVHHAVVGTGGKVYGDDSGARFVTPSTLDGDVLLLDCEGAEVDILPNSEGFETVIVETHPEFGAPTDAVLDLLDGGRIVAEDDIDGDVVVA
jgi:hypothetical protein